jgi:peptidoglycan/xylan/chitin deacetylase (PgdA/CDA1 family)
LFLRANYFLKSHNHINGDAVLLTFDDGPTAHTEKILEILNKHGISSIFFVIGKLAKQRSDLIHRLNQAGHVIGNHTQNHPNFFALYSAKKVEEEIITGQETIASVIQTTAIPFRPPIGYTNPIIGKVIKRLNIPVVGWSGRSYDTFLYGKTDSMKQRLLKITKPGRIILLHDSRQITVDTLEEYILEAKKNGIIFANKAQLNTFIDEIYRNS